MRRAKIRPSINLSASRRSVATPAAKAKDPIASKPETPGAKSGLRSSKPSTPQPVETQPVVDKEVLKGSSSQQNEQHKEKQQQQENHQQPQQQQQEQHDEERQRQQDKSHQIMAQQQRKPVHPPRDTPSTSSKPTRVSPSKSPASTPSKHAPESPAKSSTVRRKRIAAVPNLGQPRLRPGPSQPAKASVRPRATPDKQHDVGKRGDGGRGDEVGGGLQEAGDSEMVPLMQPPPVQRVTVATAPSTPTATKESTRTTSTPKDSSSQSEAITSSQTNHTPAAVTTSHRPSITRSDSVTDKRLGSENPYEKKLRELKDKMDSETPSRRRRHYVKQKIQPPERSKMTMSDLIYFNPKTSPMKNTSASKEKRFPRTIMTEHVVSANNSVNNSAHNSDNEDEEKEEDVDPYAPQVKIGPDGSVILDSTSLVKDASPAKTLHLSDNDIVQEESSHTTYASFRKRIHTTAWSEKDTAKFYRALSAVGTDFSMINAMFPKRTRQQIKNKFKREERHNRARLDKAIRERQHFDISLFNKEPSSDSEMENHVNKKARGKEGCKVTAKEKGKRKTKGRGKAKQHKVDKDGDSDKESDQESIDTEVGSKADGEEVSKDAGVDNERETSQDAVARQSEGSEEEIDMATILSHPTRSGRQPKVKTSFTMEEPPKKSRGAYHKWPQKSSTAEEEIYNARRMDRLNRERDIAFARKQAAKRTFPPYKPGQILPTPSSHPLHPSVSQANTSTSRNIGGALSPGSRGFSTISTPMGRFIVSVPQQPANRQGVTSPRPDGAASPAVSTPGAAAKKPARTHIFVISSPDGTQSVIHVPIQPDPASTEASDPQAQVQPPTTSAPGPRFHNPMTTPRIMVRTVSQNPQQTPTTVRQVVLPSARQHGTASPTNQNSNQPVNTSPSSSPRILIAKHKQRAQTVASPKPSQSYHWSKRGNAEPLALQPVTGSNKVIIMSPHVQAQDISTSNHNIAGGNVNTEIPVTNETTPDQHGSIKSMHHHESNLTPEPQQKVSHMTSDTDTDWLLRDETVGHEVDIPTSDYVEESADMEDAFIPPCSDVRHSPLGESESDQVILGQVTGEHLSAQDILEQMTYEQGVGGDVGANMEVAINEEIITQIATEMTVE